MKTKIASVVAAAASILFASAAFAGTSVQLDERLYMGGFEYTTDDLVWVDEKQFIGGFDAPAVEAVKLGAPTIDERLYIGGFDAPAQWAGRVLGTATPNATVLASAIAATCFPDCAQAWGR
jgi:hypothetical protein